MFHIILLVQPNKDFYHNIIYLEDQLNYTTLKNLFFQNIYKQETIGILN